MKRCTLSSLLNLVEKKLPCLFKFKCIIYYEDLFEKSTEAETCVRKKNVLSQIKIKILKNALR